MGGIAVLGPVRVIGDESEPIPAGSLRQCVLLAVLATRLGQVVSAAVRRTRVRTVPAKAQRG